MSPARLYSPLILVILLGFGLRLHDLQAVPLRGDEAFSVLYWADLPLSESLSTIAAGEPHTPLVYAIARLWRHIIGGIDSVFALRYLPVLGNIIGIPAIFALGWRLSRRRAIGLLAALMWAVHPFEIWHSQEFRNYAYWAGLSVTSLWLGLRLIDRSRHQDWYLYAGFGALAGLTIYTDPFIALALTCFAFIARRGDWLFLRRLVVIQLAIVTLLLGGFILLQVRPGFIERYPGEVEAFSAPDYVTRFIPVLTLGNTIPLQLSSVGIALTLALIASAVLTYRKSTRQLQFLLLLAGLPLLLLGLVTWRFNVFHPRYVLGAAPGFILLLALGSFYATDYLQRVLPLKKSVVVFLVISPWFALAALTLDAHFNDPAFRKAPAWDELGSFLNSRVAEDDLVIQLAGDAAFGYYYNGPAKDIFLPRSAAQTAEELAATLNGFRGNFASIYLVANTNPAWQNAGIVEKWMADNMQQVLLSDASGLPIYQYMRLNMDASFTAALVRFGNVVALLDYELFEDPLPSGELLLWVYWRPISQTAMPLKSFVHIYGEVNPATGSQLWTQDDQYPQRGRLDSTTWQQDQVFRDVYYLPAGSLEEGEYEVHVGWYEPAGDERVLLADNSDSFPLASLSFTESSSKNR